MKNQMVLDEQYYEELRKKLRNMKMPEPSYEDHKWTEENLRKYKELAHLQENNNHKNRSCKMFFLAETGNVLQNDFLIAAVVAYKKQGFLTREIMDKLLSYEEPIFRVEAMVETAPGSCVFQEDAYDLLEEIRGNGDQKFLQELEKYVCEK